jgi:RNA polymerase sigma-70 factor (ECF subfamily)
MRTDAQLVKAARRDPAAFRELYDRYAERIHGYHLRRTGDQDASCDLTAETFARGWLARERFADLAGGSAGPWLFAIARHVLLESVRRRALEQRACQRLGVESAGRAAAEPDDTWLDGLDEALAELPPAQREALRLRVEQDLDYEHVAVALGTTPGAARVSVHRGLTTLRARLTGAKEHS